MSPWIRRTRAPAPAVAARPTSTRGHDDRMSSDPLAAVAGPNGAEGRGAGPRSVPELPGVAAAVVINCRSPSRCSHSLASAHPFPDGDTHPTERAGDPELPTETSGDRKRVSHVSPVLDRKATPISPAAGDDGGINTRKDSSNLVAGGARTGRQVHRGRGRPRRGPSGGNAPTARTSFSQTAQEPPCRSLLNTVRSGA